eukprot:552140-Hanusia_phi.AAC.1
MAVGWDGRAAFAELGWSIAVSFCSSVVAETVRVIIFRTSAIVPELPAPDLLIKLGLLTSSAHCGTRSLSLLSPGPVAPRGATKKKRKAAQARRSAAKSDKL